MKTKPEPCSLCAKYTFSYIICTPIKTDGMSVNSGKMLYRFYDIKYCPVCGEVLKKGA